MRTNETRLWTLLKLSPMAILLFALMGNTATSCDDLQPLEPLCMAASDCEGLPHVDCDGQWQCEGGTCQFQCEPQVVSECMSDGDCENGQVCEIVDCVAPDCPNDGPCALSCMMVGECVDDVPPPVEHCDSDAECGPNEICVFECPAEACPPGADGCFVGCLGTCQEVEEPQYCMDDAECPQGMICDFSADVYCGGYEGDVPEGSGAAPVYCGGICVESSTCKVEACPPGMVFDDMACLCVPSDEFCYSDADCPAGTHCEMDEDVWCVGTDQGEAPEPMWCGGFCVPDEICIGLICPDGTILDEKTCACVPEPNPCVISGCSGQICSSHPVDTTCEWLPYYQCFDEAVTTCGPYGPNGACMWEPTATLFACLDEHF